MLPYEVRPIVSELHLFHWSASISYRHAHATFGFYLSITHGSAELSPEYLIMRYLRPVLQSDLNLALSC